MWLFALNFKSNIFVVFICIHLFMVSEACRRPSDKLAHSILVAGVQDLDFDCAVAI